ncbi:glycosyltransferase family 2 protein [Pedobacter sp. MC2016-15]|uniref:glycosyltransferase family 2 protein n=1 Tax=Pedobacter sp. MC2016-15 TaxID=2994473 RepID=UPI0022465E9E|nr:glycosyltransferase family 2 protein [Pedobacter sp. MC2016-15]MCX2478656.1 glycosyltransferase family 2 protein [Pedobacter sp. MC2016-15]
MPDITLIVSTYNWPEALRLCLLSIREQTVLPSEVIIADDGSALPTRQVIDDIKKHFPVPLLHIWHEDLGFRKTLILNKAIKQSSGTYIVQIDGDVILNKHFIQDHQSLAEPDVFIRGTRAHIDQKLLPYLYKNSHIDFNFFSKGLINRFNAIRFPILSFLFKKKSNNSQSVRGSNLAFWKSDFVLVNGYSNDLEGWGHEDEELAARFVNNQKQKIAIKFKAVQYHLSHDQSSLANESSHAETVIHTLNNKLKFCHNGYEQS